MLLRRAAMEMLMGGRLAAAAAAGGARLPPLSTAPGLLQHSWRGYAEGGKEAVEDLAPQPFSAALQQLEEAVTQGVLPADALAANRRALATLKSFAASLETEYGYPPASIQNVQFVFRDPYSEGRLQRVRCQLKLTGGNCAQLVHQSLGQLLLRLGLPPHFYFDGSQFRPRDVPRSPRGRRPAPPPSTQPASPGPAPEPTRQHVEATRARAAAAGFPSQAISEQQFRELEAKSEAARAAKAEAQRAEEEQLAKLRKIDPLLAAVAAVPWLAAHEDQASQEKVAMIRSRVVDEIESWGWDVRGAIQRVWAGERRLEQLQAGKDAGTALAVKALLFHAQQHDAKYGKKVYATLSL